jgi:hypothetical protein
VSAGRRAARAALPAKALAAVAALASSLSSAGCVQGSYSGDSIDEPIVEQRLAELQAGRTTLGHCLDTLGAPNRVYEHHLAADGTSGMALLWFWRAESGWGIEVSGSDEMPGSVSFDQVDANLPACMLWFGPDLLLERWRAGPVGELAPSRRRPTPRVDD